MNMANPVPAAQTPAVPPIAPATVAGAAPQAQEPSGSLLSALPDVNLSWSGYFEALAILCFVLALLWGALWLMKRARSGSGFLASSAPGMRIESRLALGPKKWILVVRYLDRRLLVGVTEQTISLLTDMPVEEEAAAAAPPPRARIKKPEGKPLTLFSKGDPAPSKEDFGDAFANLLKNGPQDGGKPPV